MFREIRLAQGNGVEGIGRTAPRMRYRPIDAIDGALHRMATAIGHWHRRRGAIRQLYRLNDQMLTDVGIERDRIAEAVDGMLAREAEGQR